jgi:hypothetical protein
MILREADAEHWILISQIEHARLAGELARHWRDFAFGDLEPREELLSAIAHHDDGWENWDRQPGVADGKPISFLEMPLGEATAIWRASIARCAEFGPAAGYVVAGHFCALLERFASAKADSPGKRSLADAFLTTYRRRMTNWLAELPQRERVALETHGVAVLQMFDAISLWLCCAERVEGKTQEFHLPGGGSLQLVPMAARQFVVIDWPLATDGLTLSVRGRQIPRIEYHNEAELAEAPSQPVQLDFELLSEGPKS